MPTNNPRIAVTLPPHRHDLLKRLAALQGLSMASVVSELLEECYPALERVVMVLEAAKNASEEVREGIRQSCDRALTEIEPYREEVMQQSDLFFADITRKATADGAAADREVRAAGGASATVNPRVVTRGSGSQRVTSQRARKTTSNSVTARSKAK